MPNWIHNSHASYVIAAYGLAAVVLLGFAVVSWRTNRKRQKEWQEISRQLQVKE